MDDEAPVCSDCVVDKILAQRIVDEGEASECELCSEITKTFPLSEIAVALQRIYEVIVLPAEEEMRIDPDSDNPYYEPGGDTPSEIIQEILGCEPGLADALAEYLSGLTCYDTIRNGERDIYAADEMGYHIDVRATKQYCKAMQQLRYEWEQFEWNVKHQNRFFNDRTKKYLDEIFGPLLRGELTKGEIPVLEAGPSTTMEFVFRGREASDAASRKRIYANPARELASPPPRFRRPGRMNPAGIATFYGCTDVKTCVAELRVPVGGAAIVGKFRFLRPMRLLDLRQLERSEFAAARSYFEKDFIQQRASVDFMRGVHDLLRRPVLPGDEMFDYLPTQFIAEYLAHHELNLDGILIASSLISETDDNAERGLNVILFGGSSVSMGDRGAPMYEVTNVHEPFVYDDGDEWITGSEDVERRPIPEPLNPTNGLNDHEPDAIEPSLEIVENETRVVRVRAID